MVLIPCLAAQAFVFYLACPRHDGNAGLSDAALTAVEEEVVGAFPQMVDIAAAEGCSVSRVVQRSLTVFMYVEVILHGDLKYAFVQMRPGLIGAGIHCLYTGTLWLLALFACLRCCV